MHGYQESKYNGISPVKLDKPAGVIQSPLKQTSTNNFKGVPRLMRGQYTNPGSPEYNNPYQDLD